ncbi:uncharacterized protein [Amphiura filiformis]|uniref:uncharacterized protein isoform X2 n=1 Tax=Amphiura filiformis TaxID=82378 RepID=UPI003B21BC9F
MAFETPPPAYPVGKVETDFVTLHFALSGGFSSHYDMMVYGDETILDELYPHIITMVPNKDVKRKPDCLKVKVGSAGLYNAQIQFFKMLASWGFTMKASNSLYVSQRPQFDFFFAR